MRRETEEAMRLESYVRGTWQGGDGPAALLRDASTGDEVDKVSVKLGKAGVTSSGTDQLRQQLDEVLEYVEGTPEVGTKLPPVTGKQARELVGAKQRLDGDSGTTASQLEEDQELPRGKSGKGGKAGKASKSGKASKAGDRSPGRASPAPSSC